MTNAVSQAAGAGPVVSSSDPSKLLCFSFALNNVIISVLSKSPTAVFFAYLLDQIKDTASQRAWLRQEAVQAIIKCTCSHFMEAVLEATVRACLLLSLTRVGTFVLDTGRHFCQETRVLILPLTLRPLGRALSARC